MMNKIRKVKIWQILKCDFAGWITNYKIYIVVILLGIFVSDNFDSVFVFAKDVGYRVSPCLYPFCFTHPFMRLVIFSCVILLFSDAPFVSPLQILFLSRSGKRQWYIAQIIYVSLCSVILTGFLALIPIIKNASLIVVKEGWGKVLKTLSRQFDIVHPISNTVVSRYSAQDAMIYTVLTSILIMLLIGMILYLCNVVFKNQIIGVLVSSAFVLFDWFVYIIGYNKNLLWVSPVSWVQISNMAYAREKGIPSTTFAVLSLIIMDVLLILLSYFVSKGKEIKVNRSC